MIQGFCAGGEFNGAIIFAIEHLKKNTGRIAGIITGSALIGGIFANWGVQIIEGFDINGYFSPWRILFMIGGVAGIILIKFRNIIPETPEFLSKNPDKKITFNQILKYKWQIICLFSLAFMDGVLTYTMYGFSLTYLNLIGYSMLIASNALSFAIILYIFSSILGGYISDLMPKHIYFIIITILGSIISYISFLLMNSGYVYAQAIMGLVAGFFCSSINAFAQTMFPTNIRYRTISFTYCTGIAIGGGGAPLIMLHLIKTTGNNMIPTYIITIVSVFTLISLIIYYKKLISS